MAATKTASYFTEQTLYAKETRSTLCDQSSDNSGPTRSCLHHLYKTTGLFKGPLAHYESPYRSIVSVHTVHTYVLPICVLNYPAALKYIPRYNTVRMCTYYTTLILYMHTDVYDILTSKAVLCLHSLLLTITYVCECMYCMCAWYILAWPPERLPLKQGRGGSRPTLLIRPAELRPLLLTYTPAWLLRRFFKRQ